MISKTTILQQKYTRRSQFRAFRAALIKQNTKGRTERTHTQATREQREESLLKREHQANARAAANPSLAVSGSVRVWLYNGEHLALEALSSGSLAVSRLLDILISLSNTTQGRLSSVLVEIVPSGVFFSAESVPVGQRRTVCEAQSSS